MNCKTRRWLLCVAYVHATVGLLVRAEDTAENSPLPPRGDAWAVLIGCEQYQRANPLRFIVNDARQLAATLYSTGGYGRDHLLEMTDASTNNARKPLKKNIESELPKYLKKLHADDVLFVYFSGHGFRDADGRMYLAPLDIDPKNPAPTGIPVEWLREQIARCRAAFKLLVIDACHAGSEKGEDAPALSAKELGEPFHELAGVVTLASSTADETSQIWEEKEQSLFSYWLNQGLKGSADKDDDNAVDIDELYHFVHQAVRQTADRRFHRPQTPVRIVRSDTPGVPVVIRLKPLTLNQALAQMAEQLAWAMEESGQKTLGVLEFTNSTKRGELLLSADYGTLGAHCAETLQGKLLRLGGDKFALVDGKLLDEVLKKQQMTIAKLKSAEALQGLSKQAADLPVLAEGKIEWHPDNLVHLRCELVRIDKPGTLIGQAGAAAALNESELAMTGRSFRITAADRTPRESPLDDIGPAQRTTLIANHVARKNEAHPLVDPSFPYRVWVTVNGKERRPVVLAATNEMYVRFAKGEVYEIHIENRSGRLVLMRLLVDGLNTLPETVLDKGVSTVQVAKRVSLDEARHWVLDPVQTTRFVVRGFVTETGVNGKLREFTIADLSESALHREQFSDQIGIITAAFYEPYVPRSSRSPLVTVPGRERSDGLTERAGFQVGNLLAVVNLRYGGDLEEGR